MDIFNFTTLSLKHMLNIFHTDSTEVAFKQNALDYCGH